MSDNWKGSPFVVASFAMMAAVFLSSFLIADGPLGLKLFMGSILAALLFAAFLISRFVRRNWDQIGEAKFDTSNETDK